MKFIQIITACILLTGCTLIDTNDIRIVFHGNGSTSPGVIFYTEAGKTLTVPDGENLQRYGYTFTSWNTEPDGTGQTYAPGERVTADQARNFYALWTPVSVTVTLDPMGGTLSEHSEHEFSFAAPYGTLPEPLTEEDYKAFTGWMIPDTGHVLHKHDIVSIAEDHTLQARWTDTRYLEDTSFSFLMSYAPPAEFPTGVYDTGTQTIDIGFLISQTPVTASIWNYVRDWARNNGYSFVQSGSGSGSLPVHRISWRDAIVWCNALSEMTGYDPVYTFRGKVIRDADNTLACDNAVQENTNGFRLPTTWEWEMAARWRGSDSYRAVEYPEESSSWWNPGRNASGEIDQQLRREDPAYFFQIITEEVESVFYIPDDEIIPINQTAWFGETTGFTPKTVARKLPNALNLYDMSGNVWEWTFTRVGFSTAREIRGGSFRSPRERVMLGHRHSAVSNFADFSVGFRTVRNP